MQSKDNDVPKNLFQQIRDMTVAQKIEFSRRAGKEARSILLRDPSKVVQMAVIQSPKITESEILMVARNRQVEDDVLRYIVSRKDWIKNYSIKVALVNNPKTPMAVALRLIPSLGPKDLSNLVRSKAVPRALAAAAERRLKEMMR